MNANSVSLVRSRSQCTEHTLSRRRILPGSQFRLGKPKLIGSIPRRRLHQLIEKLDGLIVVAGLLQQSGCRIEVFERIADNRDQAAQQVERSRHVAWCDSYFFEAQEIRR